MVKILMNNKWLGLILLLAVCLRVYRLDYIELFGDELDAGYQSYSLLMTGADYKGNFLPSYMHSFSEWRAPGFMYAMVPFISVFGLNEWGVRLTSATFGVINILVFYLLLAEIGVKREVGLWAALFVSVTPWHVQYSRSGFELTTMAFFLLSGTYYWIKYLKIGGWKRLFLAGGLFAAAVYTYNTANLFTPILVLTSAWIWKWQWKKLGNLLIVGGCLCGPLLVNIFWGSAADRFKLFSVWGSKEVAEEVISLRNGASNRFSKIFYNKVTLSAERIIFNYSNAFSADFLFGQGDVTLRHSLHYVGNIYWVFLPLILVGITGFLLGGQMFPADKFMLIFALLSPIPSSLTIDGFNHASRLFLLLFPLSYWAARGMMTITQKWVIYLLIAGLFFEAANYQFYFWNNYRSNSWRWWHTGYKEAMLAVREESRYYKTVLIDNIYEPSLIRYLFWNKVDPRNVFGLVDQMNALIEYRYKGFNLPRTNVFFVNFNGPIKGDSLSPESLYVFSQDINVVGDRDLNSNTPDGIKILKTIRNFGGKPIFYLVSGK